MRYKLVLIILGVLLISVLAGCDALVPYTPISQRCCEECKDGLSYAMQDFIYGAGSTWNNNSDVIRTMDRTFGQQGSQVLQTAFTLFGQCSPRCVEYYADRSKDPNPPYDPDNKGSLGTEIVQCLSPFRR